MFDQNEAQKWVRLLQESASDDGKLQAETVFFVWNAMKQNSEGVWNPGYAAYSDEMYSLWEWLEGYGYAEPFEYVEWMQDFFAKENPEKNLSWLSRADKKTLGKFLFCIKRQERFVEGLWAGQIAQGYFLKLIERVIELESSKEG